MTRGRGARRLSTVCLLLALSASAGAQGGILIQGIADVEGWSTNDKSLLLTRNNGSPGDVLRGQLWSAVEPWRGIFAFAQGQVEGGSARAYGERYTESMIDQAGIRFARDPRFVINAGKMFHPVGAFAPRNFSTRNPLIGAPDGYSPVYPVGAMVSGEVGRIDYRAAVVSLPLTHRDYQPPAGAAPRPVAGIGFTPVIGLRIGGSITVGPYLNDGFTASQLQGQSWTSYHQRMIASDLEYGIEHFDLRAEYAHASFDVPGLPAAAGNTGYVEGRYTVTPRIFVAGRGEVNNYPFIRPVSATTWIERETDLTDWEAGLGFRATESTLLKASYRGDTRKVTPARRGQALAVQVSQSFDVMDWVGAIRRK